MGLLSVIVALLAVLVMALLWRRRAYETVDFSDAVARRQSAARWMANGETAAAEAMMREAVANLTGWPRAMAHGDLATVLMASGRPELAAAQLQSACALATGASSEQEELLELRIRWARLLADSGKKPEAEQVLQAARPADPDSLDAALATEALAEFYVEEGRGEQAVVMLRAALARMVAQDSDRSAAAAVTLALALHQSNADSPWLSLDDLPEDLKSAVVVNFCDRCAELAPDARAELHASLLEYLSELDGFASECEQLRSLADAARTS